MLNAAHRSVCLALIMSPLAGKAIAQTAPTSSPAAYPTKAVRVIVPVPPGGLVDVVVRVLGQKMTEVMGQSVVVDNRAGASTNIGTELVARAAGDGYTLLSNSLPLVAEVVANSPAEFRAQIKSELGRWSKVVKENQLKAD